jgi:hypothetical protein
MDPSGSVIDQKPIQKNNDHNLTPLWKCSDPQVMSADGGRSKKIIFVHVFKTAGTSLRELLLKYALACHAGIGIVSECSGVSVETIESAIASNKNISQHKKNVKWVNGFGTKRGTKCQVRAISRTRQDITLNNLRMEQNQLTQLDLLAGHLSLGVGAAFSTEEDDVQYLTFFRNAVDKFISGIMYQKRDKHYSFQQIVELVHKRVRGELKKHKYREGYSAYLLTPQQKELFYGSTKATNLVNNTVESRTQTILDNLDNLNGNILF